MRDRDRQREEYFTQRFIIFSLEPLPQNNDPKHAAVTGSLSREEIGFRMNDQTVYISSKFPRFKFRRWEQLSFTSPAQTLTHSLFHLTAAGEFTACNASNSGMGLFLLSVFLGFSFRLLPRAKSKRVSIWLLNANRICLCSFTWNKIINAYFMMKKLIRIMRSSLWRGCTSTGKENIYKSCVSDLCGLL